MPSLNSMIGLCYCECVVLNRRIVTALLLLSPLFLVLQGQTVVDAFMTSSTTTQTMTEYTAMTFNNITIEQETFTQTSGIMNVTFTTYTTTGVTMVPVQVMFTEVYPVTITTQKVEVTYYVTNIGYEVVYSPSMVVDTVTNHYSTTETITWTETSGSTSTYTTTHTDANTATVTLTSTFDNGQPLISYVLTQNLWIVLGMTAVGLGVLAFRFGRGPGRGAPRIPPGGVFCTFCGAKMLQDTQYCENCGRQRASR